VAEAPISEIISNKDASGRIAKWAIELSPYTPQYDKRDTIKSQVLADFFIDWAEIQYEPPLPDANYWRMHFDGSKTIHGLGAGIVLSSPKNDQRMTSELWTLVLFPSYCYHLFTLLALFILLAYFHCFPLDTLIPFVSSKPVRLTTSSQVGNKVLGCVVCRFRVATG
jgi:hypothetical protein